MSASQKFSVNQKGLAPILIILILAALVGGYLVYQNQTKPTPSPQITTQPSPTSDPTVYTESDRSANWKTYTNTTQKVQFKYPPEWYLFEPNSQRFFVILSRNEIKQLLPEGSIGPIIIELNVCTNTITNEQYPCDKSLSERLSKVRKDFTSDSLSETTNFTLSGKTGAQLSGILGYGMSEGSYFKETAFQLGKYILVIDLYDKQYEDIYNQILSTFRFTN